PPAPGRVLFFYSSRGATPATTVAAPGRDTAHRTVRPARQSRAHATRSAIVQGRPAFLVADGSLAGYWLPVQKGVHL
ncbi:MAG: hypothetical protein ACTHJM_04340, partial [Marmoricola sp.]